MKNFRKACRGEKGFTLIELLVVIMILGILAAVVTLAVTKFIGKGTLESANAEAVTVQAAVESAMSQANSGVLAGSGLTGWTGTDDVNVLRAGAVSDNASVGSMMRTHTLKASYVFNSNGDIIDANPQIASGWGATIVWSTHASPAPGGKWIKV